VAAEVTLLVLRLAVAGVFLYAGAVKAWDTQQFTIDISHYELLSWTQSIVAAVYLPWLEIFAGLALLTKRLYLGTLALLAALSGVFIAAISSAWWRGLDITCGCFGKEENATNFPLHIGMNVAIVAALAVLWFAEERRRKAGAGIPSPSPSSSSSAVSAEQEQEKE
jgi:uncharacterized membrane protein YphA (DoxX/SURF4 family)